MRIKVLAFAASLLLISNASAGEPQSPNLLTSGPQRDTQAVSLLQRSFVAMGGSGGTSLSSVLLQGQMTTEMGTKQVVGSLTVKCAGPNICRQDFTSDSYSHSTVVNVDHGVEIMDGSTVRLPMHTLINHPIKYFPVFTELAAWMDPNLSIVFVGEESLNGSPVHHIHVEKYLAGLDDKMSALYSKVSGTELYLDTASLSLVKRSQHVPIFQNMGSTFVLDQLFSGYQVQNGFSIPHEISVSLNGSHFADIQITAVTFNSGVSNSDFEVQ
ncbi:MAG TPA: hypothetical protein VNZ03_13295 [Terriglobales bacterium]|jgi:hypothetical protein|nr:hypothetical protein [Terriglobales bacterium]